MKILSLLGLWILINVHNPLFSQEIADVDGNTYPVLSMGEHNGPPRIYVLLGLIMGTLYLKPKRQKSG